MAPTAPDQYEVSDRVKHVAELNCGENGVRSMILPGNMQRAAIWPGLHGRLPAMVRVAKELAKRLSPGF
jgi:hypothetical protein